MGRAGFRGLSARPHSRPEIDSQALYQRERNSHDAAGLRVNDRSDYAGQGTPAMDFVISLTRDASVDARSVRPGNPMTATWNIADPPGTQGSDMDRKTAFARA